MFQMLQTSSFLDDAFLNISQNLDVLTQTGLLYTIYQEMLVKAAWIKIMLCASVGTHFMPCWVASTFVRVLANSWSYDKWSVAKEQHIPMAGRQRESIALLHYF